MSYAATDRVNVAAGAEWRERAVPDRRGPPDVVDGRPLRGAGRASRPARTASSATALLAAGTWSRSNVAVYDDLEVNDPEGAWTLGSAVRVENFEDFGTTTNGKVSARVGFFRAGVSTGFRAPTPGQQNVVQHLDHLRPRPRRPREQRHHPVELAGGRVPTRSLQKYTLRAAHLELGGVDLDLAVEHDVLPLDRADVTQQVGVEREVRRRGHP